MKAAGNELVSGLFYFYPAQFTLFLELYHPYEIFHNSFRLCFSPQFLRE